MARKGSHHELGGELVCSAAAGSRHIQMELESRRSAGTIEWSFQQQLAAMIWLREGFQELRLDVAGQYVAATIPNDGALCFVPAEMSVAGEFTVDPVCRYALIFLDPALRSRRGVVLPSEPMMAFENEVMISGLRELAELVGQRTELLTLSLEGWAMQSVARLSLGACTVDRRPGSKGGLPEASLRRVQDYIRNRLDQSVTIDELARVAGFSRRHFIRAFQISVGKTPQRYVSALRIRQARRHLIESEQSVTSIARECGFTQVPHFSSNFRRAVGMSPSEFRSRYRV